MPFVNVQEKSYLNAKLIKKVDTSMFLMMKRPHRQN